MTTTFVLDFLLENLTQLMNCNNKLILSEKGRIKFLFEELGFLRKFIGDAEYDEDEDGKVKDLGPLVRKIVFNFLFLFFFFIFRFYFL